MNRITRSTLLIFVLSSFLLFTASANVGAIAGSNIISISGGTSSAPTYMIVSASSVGDAVYSGVVDSVTDSDTLTFATITDEDNNTVNPFFAAGTFNKDAQVPKLTASVSSGSVSSVSVSYGSDGYQSYRTGFTNAPQIIISSGDENQSTATCSISSGEITSVTVTSGGSGYSSAPEVTVVGGPHLLRITDTSSAHYGRVFLITNNTTTTLDLDFSILANGETGSTSTFFTAGTEVEVVRAPTLGNIFGTSASDLPANWSTASKLRSSSTSDWVYVWNGSGYDKCHFVNGTTSIPDGWYGTATGAASYNNLVIYPDEAFIVAKRTSGAVELNMESVISTENQKLYLPQDGGQVVCNNPYNMDLYLAELIPSTAIGSGTGKFRPGTSDDGSVDYVTIIVGGQWKKYWYNSTSTNSAVTSMMIAGSRAGTGGSSAIQSSDLSIGSGSVTNLQSCSDAAGSSVVTNYNDGNYTKISLSGTAPAIGFTITLSDLQGYMLNEAGSHEVNATTGENVDTNGSGSVVYSNLSGSFEVVGSGTGFVVVEKQRDVNFKSDEGTPAWSVGASGAGYTTTARWWAIGGGGSGAYGTVNSGGTSFTVTAGGSGYSSAPQIVISGGGWRLSGGDSSPRGNESIGASDGLIISRLSSGGVAAFIEPSNPAAN